MRTGLLVGLLTGLALAWMGPAIAAGTSAIMAVPGQFAVSSTGAATYSVPITVPPGTAGLVPGLSLSYSSLNGDGFVGLGWALNGLPSITRCPRTIAQDNGVHGSVNYDTSDRFCMDGQRLMLVGGTYGTDGSEYRTEVESFSRVIAHGNAGAGPAWFEVWTKAGQHLEFGHTTDSAVLVASTGTSSIPSGTVRVWAVNKMSDVVGNYLTVTYNCTPVSGTCSDFDRITNGEVYPLRIDYTGNAGAGVAPYNSVKFTYANRSDSVPLYQGGGVVKTNVLLGHITTYQGSSIVADYALSYRPGTATLHSHLTSLQQCDGSSHCLPATNFGWQGATNVSVAPPVATTITNLSQVVPGDWNADGLTDEAIIGAGNCIATSFPVYIGQPTFGFSSSAYRLAMPSGMRPMWPYCTGPNVLGTPLAPDGTSDVIVGIEQNTGTAPFYEDFYAMVTTAGNINLANYAPASTILGVAGGDYNGDGIVDFFALQNPTSHAYLGNLGGGFTPDGGLNIPSPTTGFVHAADFDGDGCTDILSQTGSGSTLYYAYNCRPAAATASTPNLSGVSQTLGDFNGDGKTDILVTGGPDAGLWLSTGTGFLQVTGSLDWRLVAVGDWNGDGRADLLVEPTPGADYALYLSTGTGFTPALDGAGAPIVLSGSAGGTATVADWNNDGNSDLLIQTVNSGPPISYSDWYSLIVYTPELMTSVSNGIGATTNISYDRINKNGGFYVKGNSASYPVQDMDGPQYVVSEVDASNGLGTCSLPATTYCYKTTYSYAGAQKDLHGRGFLGFQQVVITDPQTGVVQTTNYSTTFPYVGLVTSQTKVHGSVTLFSITNSYTNNLGCGVTPAGSGVYIDCLTQSVAASNDLNGAAFPTSTSAYTYDSYGNALSVNVSLSDGSSKNTTNTYLNDTSSWFLGRLLTTSVNSVVGGSNLTRQSSFAYNASTGLLTQETIEPGVSACNGNSSSCTLTTSYTYDTFGNRITSTVSGSGIATRTSYSFYDTKGQFQTSAANALGQYEFWTYDINFGGPTSHTGPNFLSTNWAYDGFGRLTLERRPDGTRTVQSYGYCSGQCPATGQFYGQSQMFAADGSTQVGPSGAVYYDMLSRSIATDTQGFDGSNTRVATVYDSNGRVQETSRPYFTGTASPAWTQYSYDDLGRVTQTTFPDGSHTVYGFNGLTTSVTNNLSQTTTTTKNAQGLNYQVSDTTSHATTYIYDAFGDLVTVTDPAGNTTANSYDIRGNKILSRDADMGSWAYSYDVLAELTAQTDAKGQTTALSYDVLGRALSRTEPGLYSAWTYGVSAGAHDIGQLTEARACAAPGCTAVVSDKAFTFDALGRPVQTQIRTATDAYGYSTAYNATNGQIASVTYPSGLVVARTYNARGYLTNMVDGYGSPIWAANARDAELHLTSQTAGNGVSTVQQFSSATGLIQSQRAGGGAVVSFDYGFDTLGNLTFRTDNTQSYTERFCYDSLNRLTSYNMGATCTGGSSATYDAIGNITSKSDAGSYSYGGAGPHAVSSITGTVDGLTNPKYGYDANGNLTCVSSGTGCSGTLGRTIVSTSFNMAAQMIQGANSLSLGYDDQHQRIQQVNTVSGTATTTTVYLNDPNSGAMSERVAIAATTATAWNGFNWGAAPWGGATPNTLPTWTDYIAVDGQIIAQHTVKYPLANAWGFHNWGGFNWGPPPGTNWGAFNWGAASWSGPVVKWEYFNLDHLGSVAVITDQGGNVIQRLSYDAWGKQRNFNGSDAACGAVTASTTRGFTNQEQMPTACIVNLNARLYDPSIGKFMAADSIIGNPYDGQSFNRYSYVLNNPLSGADPTGHLCDVAVCTGGPEFNGLPDYHYGSQQNGNWIDTDSSGRPTQYLSFPGSSTGANSVIAPIYYNGSPAGFSTMNSPAARLPADAFQEYVRATFSDVTYDSRGSIENVFNKDVRVSPKSLSPITSLGTNGAGLSDCPDCYQVAQVAQVGGISRPSGTINYKSGVPAPSDKVKGMLECIAQCSGDDLRVTETSGAHPSPTDPHTQGLAADLTVNQADRQSVLICSANCGAVYQQNEYANPSANATGGHLHLQMRPGLGGATGPYYPVPTPTPRPDD